MKILFLVATQIISLQLFAEDVPGKNLLTYFSESCKTNSHWTQSAIADSEALIKSLNTLSNDTDCSGAIGAISQLNSLSSQLATLNKLNESKNTVASLNAEEQQLLIHLTQTTNADALAEINTSLRELQVKRAKLLNGDKSAEKLSGEDKVTVLAQIANSANASFQQITANQKCVNKHPNILQSATSIIAGVGSAVTLVNPVLGLSLTAGAVFTKVAMDGIKGYKDTYKIRSIADSTITFEAYSCALESMTDRWCQMKDAESFLKFKSINRKKVVSNSGLAKAISLNDREIPAILDWLNKIRNGVAPRTTADASRRSNVLSRELMVRAKTDYGQSLLEQNRKIYDSLANNPSEQWKFLSTLITTLAPQFNSGPTSSDGAKDPLNDIITPEFAPYNLLGLKEDDERIRSKNSDGSSGGFLSFSSWIKPAEVIVSLDSVKARYLNWMDRATNLVNRELTEVQQPDPLQTLSSANLEAEPWMISPLEALKTIIDFLEINSPRENQRDFKKIYQDTLIKLKNIYETTTMAIYTGDMSARQVGTSNLTPIEQIYDSAQLKYGIVVLQARLEMIVRLSLLEYIKNSPDEDQILMAQLLASDRFYETISKMSGTTNYSILKEDIKTGKAYTMKNLASFMNIFGHNINRTLRKLYKEERGASPTVAQSNRDLRTSMCFLVLGAENVKEWIDAKLCAGLKMDATEVGGPESFTIDKSTFSKDLNDRACTYREYFRQSDIYQKWGIKN